MLGNTEATLHAKSFKGCRTSKASQREERRERERGGEKEREREREREEKERERSRERVQKAQALRETSPANMGKNPRQGLNQTLLFGGRTLALNTH